MEVNISTRNPLQVPTFLEQLSLLAFATSSTTLHALMTSLQEMESKSAPDRSLTSDRHLLAPLTRNPHASSNRCVSDLDLLAPIRGYNTSYHPGRGKK